MSKAFDGSSNIGKATTTQPSYATFTAMGWFYISTDNNRFSAFFYAHEEGSDIEWVSIGTSTDGTTLACDRTAGATTGTNLTVGKWYHLCLTKAGSAHIIYLNGTPDITVTDAGSVTSIDSFYWMGFNAAGTPQAYGVTGRCAALKLWSGAALTRGEVRAEMAQFAPLRQSGLYGFWPCRFLPRLYADYSGRAHPLVASGAGPTHEDNPQIPWEVTSNRTRKLYTAPGGGTGSGLLLGGVRNYLVREAY